MVEQTDALLDKDHTQLLGGLEDGAVVLATSRGGDVLDAGAGSAEDVVDEGELDTCQYIMKKQVNGKNSRMRQTRQPPHSASAARLRAPPG